MISVFWHVLSELGFCCSESSFFEIGFCFSKRISAQYVTNRYCGVDNLIQALSQIHDRLVCVGMCASNWGACVACKFPGTEMFRRGPRGEHAWLQIRCAHVWHTMLCSVGRWVHWCAEHVSARFVCCLQIAGAISFTWNPLGGGYLVNVRGSKSDVRTFDTQCWVQVPSMCASNNWS